MGREQTNFYYNHQGNMEGHYMFCVGCGVCVICRLMSLFHVNGWAIKCSMLMGGLSSVPC